MANWLNFEKMREWEFPVFVGFAYDWITDDDIRAALTDEAHLNQVDPTIDWEDDRWLSACTDIPATMKHAYRVAALVRAFRTGEQMHRTISVDTFTNGQCSSCVGNGHHRIRALQFMSVPAGPFGLSGLLDELESLVRLAGADCPAEAERYFAPSLLQREMDDVAA